jgi:hypothetical protein
MALPKGKGFVHKVPAWGEKSAMGGRGPAGGVKPVRPVLKSVRPVWRQQGDQFGFRAHDESRLVAGGRGYGGWFGELAGGEFAGRSPPRDQYDYAFPIMVVVLLQCDRSGFPMVVPGLIGLTGWITILIGAVG